MNECSPRADDEFGPQVVACRQGFDFTLLFEQTILSAVPSAILLLASCAYVAWRSRQSVKLAGQAGPIVGIKQTAILAFACTQLALLILWSQPSAHPTKASMPASALSVVSCVAIAILSYVEHERSIRPSTLLSLYLLFSTVLDVGQARTLFFRDGNRTLAIVFAIGLGLKAIMFCIETLGKRHLLKAPYRNYPPEALGSAVNRGVFWWLNSLLLRGSSKSLTNDDLFDLDDNLRSESLHARFRAGWRASNKTSYYSLFLSSIQCAWRPLARAVLGRLFLIAFRFSQPLLIDRAVTLLAPSSDDSEFKKNSTRALIGATALVYFGIALAKGFHEHNSFRFITVIRGGLICLIQDTTLSLDAGEAREAAAVTLMSTDIDRIINGFETLASIWAGPVEIAIGTYLLWNKIGIVSVAAVLLATLFVSVALSITKKSANSQKAWVESVQKRVAATSSALTNIKGVKMAGLSGVVTDNLAGLRTSEINTSRKYRWVLTASAVMSNMSLIVISTGVISAYVLSMKKEDAFEPAVIFTSLSLISLISTPVQNLAFAIPMLASSLGCFHRIQLYLQKEAVSQVPERERTFSVSSTLHEDLGVEMDTLRPAGFQYFSDREPLISVQNADFRFRSSEETVLHNIHLEILPRSWTVILGPIGSGKSALLLALLGELDIVNGSLEKASRLEVAYCGQEPWLPNLTVLQIIVGFSGHHDSWYWEVVRACALATDLESLPQGDETTIGSNGVQLSGGQKQRISLARALYSRKPLLLLDDVMSGLDPTTERHIADHVLGTNGVCQRHGITVMLATHSVHHADQANHVIVMGPGGKIATQAAPRDISWRDIESEDEAGASSANRARNNTTNDQAGGSGEVQAAGDSGNEGLRADLTRRTGDFTLYGYYLRSVGRGNTAVMSTAEMLYCFCVAFPPIWLKWWTDAELKAPGEKRDMYLGIYGSFSLMGLFGYLTLIMIILHVGMPRSSIAFHRRLLDALASAPYWFFASTDSGQVLNRFSQDLSLIDMHLPIAFINAFYAALLVVAQAAILGSMSTWSLPMFPPLFVLLWVLQKFYLRTSRQMRLLDLEAKSPLYTHFSETLQGLSTIRAFGWQEASTEKSHGLLDQSQKPFYLMWCIQRWLNFVLDCVVAIVATVIMGLAMQGGTFSAGALGVALVNILSMSSNLTNLIRNWVDMETSLGAVSRVRSFERDTPNENLPGENSAPPKEWPAPGAAIELRGCSVSYKPGSDQVLRGVNLTIQAGHKVAICGRTGSGKSSTILSLLRMVEIGQGDILIDGLSLQNMPRETVRQRLTVMPQDPLLLAGPIRNSIDPASEHLDPVVINALEEVGMWDLIRDRGGLNTNVSECRLSRGQQQLVCLARALLGQSQILLLDEATSNLDPATRDKMMDVIRRSFAGRTVVVVAHHLRTVRNFDQIVVMEQGNVVEQGAPGELLKGETRFRALWDSQA